MKICYLGDANIQVRLVSEHFRANGHDVHLCTFRPGAIPGVKVHPLLSGPLLSRVQYLGALPRLRRLLRAIRPDVVHAFYVSSYGFLGSVASPERLVISAMGSDILMGPAESWVLRWFVRRALRRSRFILSVATHLTEELIRLGAPASRIRTFPRGVDVPEFQCGAVPQEDRKPEVVCIRKLEPLYNHRVLVEAAPQILASRPDIRFILCGEGFLRKALMRRCADLGVAGAFRFVGNLPHERIADLLKEAAIYFSGAVSDGTSVSLLEAMAAGAYPVVTDIAANRAWIEDGRNGALFTADDPSLLASKILGALADASERETAASINLGIVRQRASWSEGMRRFEVIYRKVADGDARGNRAESSA